MDTYTDRKQQTTTTAALQESLLSAETTSRRNETPSSGTLEVWQADKGRVPAHTHSATVLHVARPQDVQVRFWADGVVLVRIKDTFGHVLAEDMGSGDLTCAVEKLQSGYYEVDVVNRAGHELDFRLSVHGEASAQAWYARNRSRAA